MPVSPGNLRSMFFGLENGIASRAAGDGLRGLGAGAGAFPGIFELGLTA